ncbi:putative transferase CAF17, mitochondrial [Orchesella cincta]|uniref:Putative transferase CAF17, mitochondrial n=1 Tax=Orchesella cincta TaxID=48709 RepID=A0A1D2NAP6_ORCCI|nr:putative transferase CAF17, mitochondrial [Orchesella cincta]
MIQCCRSLSSRVVNPYFLSSPVFRPFPPRGRQFFRNYGDSVKKRTCKFEAVLLKSRSLLRLQGPDTHQLLHGLITNDITHLDSRPAIYALFLNTQGRVLHDSLIFNVAEGSDRQTYVECDSSVKSNLIKHLKTFKLRKKVDIVDVEEETGKEIDLWVVFDHGHTITTKELVKEECCGPVIHQTSKRPELPISVDSSLRSFGDPRLNELGWRVLVPRNKAHSFPPDDITVSGEESYTRLRYALGVAEGVKELPSGSCFPLESNGDYLHGISFQKGCYIGQELTARTHHTGVVRKRIMPFGLENGSVLTNLDPAALQIVNSSGKVVGKVRGICESVGIGLVRIEEALSATELQVKDHNLRVNVEKPFWWPIEASKEKQTRQ